MSDRNRQRRETDASVATVSLFWRAVGFFILPGQAHDELKSLHCGYQLSIRNQQSEIGNSKAHASQKALNVATTA